MLAEKGIAEPERDRTYRSEDAALREKKRELLSQKSCECNQGHWKRSANS